MRHFATAVLLLAAAPAAAFNIGPSGPPAVAFDPTTAAAQAGTLTKVTSAKTMSGLHRVAIAQFHVEYVTESLGLTKKQRNQTTVTYHIATPLPDSSLQAQTDRLYAAFVAQLTAAGYEVVPRETVQHAASWAPLAAIAKASPSASSTESGKGRLTNAFGDPTYYPMADVHAGGFGSMGSAFSMGVQKEVALANELGATVLDVRLVAGFKETDRHSDLFALGRSGSSFVGSPKLVAQAIASGIIVTPPSGSMGTVALNSDLMFAEDTLAENMKMETSGGQQAVNVAAKAAFGLRVLGGLVPGVGALGAMKLETAYKVACGPAETSYLAAIDHNMSAVTELLVARMAAAKSGL